MNLYQALQGVLDKIKQNNESVLYAQEPKEQLRAVLDNQERLAESILIMGGILQGLVSKEVEIEIIPKNKLRN